MEVVFVELLKNLVISGAIKKISSGVMPNIPFPTMGGEIFWDTIASYGGWRVQRNTFFGNCRILDPNDIRRAWGSMNAMEELFKKLDK